MNRLSLHDENTDYIYYTTCIEKYIVKFTEKSTESEVRLQNALSSCWLE